MCRPSVAFVDLLSLLVLLTMKEKTIFCDYQRRDSDDGEYCNIENDCRLYSPSKCNVHRFAYKMTVSPQL